MAAMTADQMWNAIDTLARVNGLSKSGLAKAAGLDPTAFNPSRRRKPDGAMRWVSFETINPLLDSLDMSLADFAVLATTGKLQDQANISVRKLTYGGPGRRLMEADKPAVLPRFEGTWAIEIQTHEMAPKYRFGDIIFANPSKESFVGDDVVARMHDNSVIIGTLATKSPEEFEIIPVGSDKQVVRHNDIMGLGKIVGVTSK